MLKITPIFNTICNSSLKKQSNDDKKDIFKNNTQLTQQLNQKAILGFSQVNFTSNRFNFDSNDEAFMDYIFETLEVNEKQQYKLKDFLEKSLEKFNISSLSEIDIDEKLSISSLSELDMDENFKDTTYLLAGFNDILNEDNNVDKTLFITKEFTKRIKEGDNYSPSEYSLDEFIDLNNVLKNVGELLIQQKHFDEVFLSNVAYTFNLDSQKLEILKNTINKFLNEMYFPSLSLLKDDDFVEDEAVLSETVKENLGLSEEESLLFDNELTNRIFSEDSYTPVIHPMDTNFDINKRDTKIYNKVMSKYDLSDSDKRKFHYGLKEDAYKRHYSSIFQLFDEGNDTSRCQSMNYILCTDKFSKYKYDIIIDLYEANKNMSKIEDSINKDELKAERNGCISNAIISNICEEFNFSKKEIVALNKYLKKQDYNNEKVAWKIAYEISNQSNLPTGSEEKIVKIVEQFKNIEANEEERSMYGFAYAKLLMGI